jgi:hypothetical protein
MLLLFFLMVAMGGLMVIWIMFPGAGVQMPDPLPPRPQTVIVAPQTADSRPGGAEAPSTDAASAASPSAPDASTTVVSGIADLPPAMSGAGAPAAAGTSSPADAAAGNTGTQPAPIDLDELRRTLEQLVGNPPPPTRP